MSRINKEKLHKRQSKRKEQTENVWRIDAPDARAARRVTADRQEAGRWHMCR